MKKLSSAVISFFKQRGCVIVSTIDRKGFIHNSCKGIVDIKPEGEVYILDLYQAKTLENILNNPVISIAALDEHQFLGWCLKGKAKIIPKEKIEPHLFRLWESKISSRIAERMIRNISKQKISGMHPEILLPKPKYLIKMKVIEIINLIPKNLIRR